MKLYFIRWLAFAVIAILFSGCTMAYHLYARNLTDHNSEVILMYDAPIDTLLASGHDLHFSYFNTVEDIKSNTYKALDDSLEYERGSLSRVRIVIPPRSTVFIPSAAHLQSAIVSSGGMETTIERESGPLKEGKSKAFAPKAYYFDIE
ncbi:MAG: hypothetical protein M3Q97_01055 [Bacteroidota bacterium]|nr:hypothetical protein [Bacteroidota bacterium]